MAENRSLSKADMLACLNRYYGFKAYKRQCVWNNKIARLLEKEPKPMTGFSFMPKGDVE